MPTLIQNVIIDSLLGILEKVKQLFVRLWADFEAVE